MHGRTNSEKMILKGGGDKSEEEESDLLGS
jgi:hypothetical protein